MFIVIKTKDVTLLKVYDIEEIPIHLKKYFEPVPQLGLEPTPELYVEHLVMVFQEVKRVLRDDGTIWVNLGDSYWGSGNASGHTNETKNLGYTTSQVGATKGHTCKKHPNLKPKDLVGIPWMVAFALRDDGWYLRSDIIWQKPNPMPESVRDRPTKSHEYIFLLSKSKKYYYDANAIRESNTNSERTNYVCGSRTHGINEDRNDNDLSKRSEEFTNDGRNKRSVWTITTKPYPEAHFATFPPDLIQPCILAGCSKGGVVLDPFGGSGTVAFVCDQNDRDWILIDVKKEYCELMLKRIGKVSEQRRQRRMMDKYF